jgi:phosphoribosylformylglycinamidine synthase subunit PurQ / glutaminase
VSARILILRGYGFNCEEETLAAYQALDAAPVVVHVSDWLNGHVRLDKFDVLHVPGGFSFGDVLGSGQVFANQVRSAIFADGTRLWDNLIAFLNRDGRVVGVCNGFQALVRLGLLPNLSGTYAPEASLAANPSGKFEDRWVHCAITTPNQAVFGTRPFELPVRHGEGRLVYATQAIREEVQRLGLCVLQYADAAGQSTSTYPDNPNSSDDQTAALLSKDRRVFGLMPHPEAYVSPYNHPDWPTRKRHALLSKHGDGIALLSAILRQPTAPQQQAAATHSAPKREIGTA